MASNKDINRLKIVLGEKKRTGKWLAEQLNTLKQQNDIINTTTKTTMTTKNK